MADRRAHVAIEIHAPIERVWAVLLDTDAYPDWNPFVVAIDRPRGPSVVGERFRMRVRWANGKEAVSEEEVCRLEPPAGSPRRAVLDWAFRGPLDALGLVRAYRTQLLEERADGVTLYRTEETFGGLAKAVLPVADVQDGFERMAVALRDRAEALVGGPAVEATR